ncbi:hypothetical protein BH09BAC4_BH09BAC4_50170 [soil metagenome]
MLIFREYIRIIGLCAVLFLLAGTTTTWAQGFKISGKACVPDQECKADSITFTDSSFTGAVTRVWDFGDGTAPTTRKDSVARHVYQTAGRYTVTLTRTVNGKTVILDGRIQINGRPPSFTNWRTDTTICKGETITLDPYPGGGQAGYRYLWYPKGDTTQSIQVDSSGCYSVEAISPNGCSYQDRINVDVCGEKKESQGGKG